MLSGWPSPPSFAAEARRKVNWHPFFAVYQSGPSMSPTAGVTAAQNTGSETVGAMVRTVPSAIVASMPLE
jgi:hypothetical protein